MAKNKNRRKKKRHLAPALSTLDKALYYIGFIIAIIIPFSILMICLQTNRDIAFEDSEVIAFNTTASALFVFPFTFTFLVFGLSILAHGYESKFPIFGRKDIKYGEYPYKTEIYPLFRKRSNYVNKSPNSKRTTASLLLLLCTVLIVFACLIPFSLYGRKVMYEDYSISKFNAINAENYNYDLDDYESLTIRAYYHSRKHGGDWTYEITIKTQSGKKFQFAYGEFRNGEPDKQDYVLDRLLKLKSQFDKSSIFIEGIEHLNKVIKDCDLNASQTEKLRELFAK
ncbi:MAG: hypothetical protein IJX97_05015 [Clostridia bacterium]|nr:hypothetical protein [Clostridia bacterium]